MILTSLTSLPLNTIPIFTVKYISQAIQSVALVLYKVQLDKSVKEGICKRETVWKTIDEMAKNPKAMKSNYDVIEWLQRHRGNLHDSFVLKPGTLHIIWNITGKCHAGCKICATRDLTRIEVWPEDKLRILNALAEIKREKNLSILRGEILARMKRAWRLLTVLFRFLEKTKFRLQLQRPE